MDPYLEAPDFFPDLHAHLASALSGLLNAALPHPYYARMNVRHELGLVLEAGALRSVIPDVVVSRRLREPPGQWGNVAVADSVVVVAPRKQETPGVEFRIHTDPVRHTFVEVRDAARGHKLVTFIEIVSPSNKKPGPDRRAYENKQREVLESDASVIELDLLRTGRRLLPYLELEAAVHDIGCDYLMLLNRASLREDRWMDYTLYPVKLRETLPCIPVPLAGADPDVLLDLQVAFNRAYLDGPYLRAVDYTAEPDPPLREEDRPWAAELLRAAGLRGEQAERGEGEEVMERG